MTDGGEQFDTPVEGVVGSWPQLPSMWSHSSLLQAERCPRQWMLERARYPVIWDRSGYPRRPQPAALAGQVVHDALERIVKAMVASGCEDLQGTDAVQVLRGLGGYGEIVKDAIDACLDALRDNPRATQQMDALARQLRTRGPELRLTIQSVLSRLSLSVRPAGGRSTGSAPQTRGRLNEGTYAEWDLRAPELRLMGRVDLLIVTDSGCEIVDYKSGEAGDDHAAQVELYALLWHWDLVQNPDRTRASRLMVAYPTHEVEFEPPGEVALQTLRVDTEARIDAVEIALDMRPPSAVPSPAACRHCSVRQLCDDYWTSEAAREGPSLVRGVEDADRHFFDVEVTVLRRNGPSSWWVAEHFPGSPAVEEVLLRTVGDQEAWDVGTVLRLLAVAESRDEDNGRRLLTLTTASEVHATVRR